MSETTETLPKPSDSAPTFKPPKRNRKTPAASKVDSLPVMKTAQKEPQPAVPAGPEEKTFKVKFLRSHKCAIAGQRYSFHQGQTLRLPEHMVNIFDRRPGLITCFRD